MSSGGQVVSLQSPMGIVKTQHCSALLIGFVAESSGERLKEDFVEILNSAR